MLSNTHDSQPHRKRDIIIALISQFEEYSIFNEVYFQTYLAETTRFYEEESEHEAAQVKDNPSGLS